MLQTLLDHTLYEKFNKCEFYQDKIQYIGHVDGANHFSRNIALTAWAIFTPFHTLVISNEICIGSATNNQVEYDVVIDFLVNALSHHILHLHFCLDSFLLFMQLNGVYHVHNQVLFRKYLWVKPLVHEFETITFRDVPRA